MHRPLLVGAAALGMVSAAATQEIRQVGQETVTPIERVFGGPQANPHLPTFRRGEILIRYRGGLDQESATAEAVENELNVSRTGFNSSLGIFRYELPEGTTVAEALRALRNDNRIDFAEPNFYHYLHDIPNDPFYDNYNGVASDLQKWAMDGNNVNAELAWDVTTGRSDVIIAIVDSGIDLDHPDLAANIWTNPGEIPGNGSDDDSNGFTDDVNGWDFYSNDNDPNPDYGDGFDNDFNGAADDGTFHGTFSASCAAAVGDNGTGLAGGSWGCTLMSLKVFTDDGGAPIFDIADAVTYAANNGADIINMSLGGGFSSTLQNACAYATSQGLVQVASAGNGNSSSVQYPAGYSNVISVGASDSGSVLGGGSGDIDGRASFSQYGTNAVDVVAPGASLVGAGVGSVAEGNPGVATYYLASGTSFSAPMVAGLAGLVISRGLDTGASLSHIDVENIIQNNTIDLPDDPNDSPNGGANWDGNGLVNFRACVDAVQPPTNNPPVAAAGPDQSGTVSDTYNFDGSGSSDPDGDPLTYAWDFGDGNTDTGALVSHTYGSAGTYTVTLTVSDGSLNDNDTLTVTVSDPPGNDPPVANAGADQSGLTTDTFNFDGSGSSDPNGDPLTYAWDFGDGNTDTGVAVSHSYGSAGTYTVTLTVDDGEFSDNDTLTVTVSDPPTNDPPVAAAGPDQAGLTTDTFNFDGSGSSDPNGDPLTYAWDFGDGNTDTGVAVSHSYGSAGTYTVTLTVDDGEFSDNDTLTVTVNDPPVGGAQVYMTNGNNVSVPGIGTLRNEDVYIYDVDSGSYSWYMDGSDLGIGGTAINGVTLLPDGDVLFTMTASFSVPGLVGGPGGGTTVDDSDIVRFTPSSTGSNTAGVLTFHFDGSDVALTSNGEDIDGLSTDSSGNLVISSVGGFSGTGQSGSDEDIFVFSATSLGASTSGSFSRIFDGSDVGLGGSGSDDLSAVHWGSATEFYVSTYGTLDNNAGYTAPDEDLSLFTATSTGNSTAGSFSLYLDVSATGISTGEDTRGLYIDF